MVGLHLEQMGNIDNLKLKESVIPKISPSEVLVKVKAAALNHRDVWIMQGLYAKIQLPVILGSDGSGVVTEVGEGVDEIWQGKSVIINPALGWGDNPRVQQKQFRILGMPDNGTQADYVAVPAENIFEMPGHLTFEEAAALPLAGLTGYRALFTQGLLKIDNLLLITGIGGGVAALIMQMAVAAGGRIYVTSGDDLKIQKAIELGAENGANYRQDGWAASLGTLAGGKGFDLIIDSAGGAGFQQLIDLVTPGGKIVIFGATAGTPGDVNLRKIFWNQVCLQGTTMGTPDDFRQMVKFITTHKIKPVIHKVYDLSDYKKAYEDMIKGKQFGKIVLRVAE